MYLVVMAVLSAVVLGLGWMLAHSAPSIIARILPRTLTFVIGALLAGLGAFGGYSAAMVDDGPGVIGCFVMIIVGMWFMLVPSSMKRGTPRDEELLKRIFAILGLIFALTVVTMYLPEFRAIAIANLIMVTAGFWITTNYLRHVDEG